ncbi:MAG: hypothetical protein KAI43_12755 [Candidatus Aureabacteria bacterium]|nr:hypothetical protein [Candidatus Auribacterota bacterium]
MENLKRCLSLEKWSASNVKAFMIYLRELLESNNIKKSFRFINLYSDWCAHTEITRSHTAFDLLKKLTIGIGGELTNPGSIENGDLHKRIIDISGILQLREEIKELLNRYNLPSVPIDNWDTWKGILGLLLQDLSNKPIKFPNPLPKNLLSIYEKLKLEAKNLGDVNWTITGFCFFIVKSQPFWEVFSEYLTKNQIRLIGPVSLPPKGNKMA